MVVPPGDAAAMAAAVLKLLRDDELARRLARSAREVACSHSWLRVREQWHEVYAGGPVGVAARSMDALALGKERQC